MKCNRVMLVIWLGLHYIVFITNFILYKNRHLSVSLRFSYTVGRLFSISLTNM